MDSVGRLLFLHGVSVAAANINEDLTESVSCKIWCWTYKCLRGIAKGKNFPKKLGRKLRVVFLLVGSYICWNKDRELRTRVQPKFLSKTPLNLRRHSSRPCRLASVQQQLSGRQIIAASDLTFSILNRCLFSLSNMTWVAGGPLLCLDQKLATNLAQVPFFVNVSFSKSSNLKRYYFFFFF